MTQSSLARIVAVRALVPDWRFMNRSCLLLKLALAIAAFAAFASPCRAADIAWTGTWALDQTRPEPDGAADAYRFTVSPDGTLVWEIPSLGEIVRGRLDGKPMPIHRSKPTPGLTIAVTENSPRVWTYTVARNGTDAGAGRMALAADGKSWTDIPLDHGKPVDSLLMVYVKK